MNQRLPISSSTLADFCRRHRIARLALFGSMQTESHRPDSDIDLLVEFESGHEPGLIALAGMELELSELLDLSRYFRDEVQNAAEVQYAI